MVKRTTLVGAGYLVLAAACLVGGQWLLSQEPGAPAPEKVDDALAQVARQITASAPTAHGATVIMGAGYAQGDNTLTIDLRANRDELGDLPDRLFVAAAETLLGCARQSRAMAQVNRDTSIRYRLFGDDGIALSAVTLKRGACTSLPLDLPAATPQPMLPFGE